MTKLTVNQVANISGGLIRPDGRSLYALCEMEEQKVVFFDVKGGD